MLIGLFPLNNNQKIASDVIIQGQVNDSSFFNSGISALVSYRIGF